MNFFKKDSIAIGKELAISLDLIVGDTVTLMSTSNLQTPFGNLPLQEKFTISSVFSTGLAEFDQNVVFMPFENAKSLFELTDKNINKWSENEFKYRGKYGPNYEKKIVNITSEIPIKIHGLNLRGPIREDSSSTYMYQFTYTIDDIKDINYFDRLNKYNYSFTNYF